MYNMTEKQALEIVAREARGMKLGFLETLMWMQANYDELGAPEQCAFSTAFRGFQNLFAPVTE